MVTLPFQSGHEDPVEADGTAGSLSLSQKRMRGDRQRPLSPPAPLLSLAFEERLPERMAIKIKHGGPSAELTIIHHELGSLSREKLWPSSLSFGV